MKLQKLIISAFGPYAEKQVLDFETYLCDKRMFVISGNTGAGKTTIFDAINFALYGSASGSERDGKSLRSDFAPPDVDTEIELWFSIRDKEYYVKRCPQYERPKLRGEGITKKSAYAEMKYITDNKLITGYNDVSNEIENILGINSAQFKQLVMIPQGEFKKLLNADSREKEIIFRKIFSTETFEKIQKQIVEKANILSSQIGDSQKSKENAVKRFIHNDDILKEMILAGSLNYAAILERFKLITDNDVNTKTLLDSRLLEINAEIDNLKSDLLKGEENNRKLKYLETKKNILQSLNAQKYDFEKKLKFLSKAKKASELKIYEEKYQDILTLLGKRKEFSLHLEKDTSNLAALLKDAETELQKQKNRENEKAQLVKNFDIILRLKEKASDFTQKQEKLKLISNKLASLSTDFENNQKLYAEAEKEINSLSENLENIHNISLENSKLENDLNRYRELYSKINTLINNAVLFENTLNKHQAESLNFKKIEEEFKTLKSKFEELDDSFKKNQAGILAGSLIEGAACPVCGSIEHPSPAKLDSLSVSEIDVKKAKANFEKIAETREHMLQNLTSLKQNADSIKLNLISPALEELLGIHEFENISDFYEKLTSMKTSTSEKGKSAKEAFDKNEKIISQKETILNKKKEAELKLISIKEYDTNLKNDLENYKLEYSALKENINLITLEFGGNPKGIIELEKEEYETTLKIKSIEDSLILAENKHQKLKTDFDNISGQKIAALSEIKNLEEECLISKNTLEAKLSELEFKNFEYYKAYYLEKEQFESLESEINIFNDSLKSAETALKEALENTKELSFTDLETLSQKLQTKKSEASLLETEIKSIDYNIINNRKIIGELETLDKKTSSLESDYKTIGFLSNLIKGENSAKTSFERYVLSAYYEDIIAAANIRFSRMSMGRFELSRKQEVSDARKKSGLDLEVFDNYTGKSRDIKTLSGGESFKASLSMALGLADVVQSYSGGIQLDTMFIDEGFGTLDPESLDKAIECLIELQHDGRVVGIISHVPELKERIDAKLEVSSTNSGSVASFHVD
ncbi:MAG: SbcC/MukB-like Walker B domain-containing protein [Proteocatella sp.]